MKIRHKTRTSILFQKVRDIFVRIAILLQIIIYINSSALQSQMRGRRWGYLFMAKLFYIKFVISLMNIERSKKLAGVTDGLNKKLTQYLESFAANTEWTDIHNWLTNVEVLLTDFPSPFIADKILLSKRLNQCMNPILPEKVHETVLHIHQRIFKNMRASVDGNINDYIKLFA